MTIRFSPEELDYFDAQHSMPEFAVDVEATMATVADEPDFEWHPLGLRIVGRDAVRAMYGRLLPTLMPNVEPDSGVVRTVTYGDAFMFQELSFGVRLADGSSRSAPLAKRIEFDADGRVRSERFYVSGPLVELAAAAFGGDFPDSPGVARLY